MKVSSLRSAFVIFALATAGVATTATGCDGLNDCDEAKARIQKRLEFCIMGRPIDFRPDTTRIECTDAAGTLALCQADVFDEASCDCVIGICSPAEAQIFKASFDACE